MREAPPDPIGPVAKPEPTLMTRRLILRRWREADLEPFADLNADPDVMRFLSHPLDRAASDAFAGRIETQFERRGYGLWAVERVADGAFLGFTGLAYQEFDATFTPCVEVGWRFARAVWGHGYATEAAREALRFGFQTVGLPEIVSLTSVGHERSRRVMERLGMRHDPAEDFDYGPMRPDDPHRRHVLYRLSQADWPHRAEPHGPIR